MGNDLAAGQVKEIVDAYDYFLKVENITKTTGGRSRRTTHNIMNVCGKAWKVFPQQDL